MKRTVPETERNPLLLLDLLLVLLAHHQNVVELQLLPDHINKKQVRTPGLCFIESYADQWIKT